MQIFLAYQLSGLSALICIKLIKLYKNEIIQKIRAKWESGLTAVWLKRDPPVLHGTEIYLGWSFSDTEIKEGKLKKLLKKGGF